MQKFNQSLIFKVILLTFLVGFLSACSVSFSISGWEPSRSIVQQAIAIQLQQTQDKLIQELQLSQPPKLKINQLIINFLEPLKIENLPSFHLKGTYELDIQVPDRPEIIQPKNSFDIYLQRQKEGKTWRLARQEGKNWNTYFVPPKGYYY